MRQGRRFVTIGCVPKTGLPCAPLGMLLPLLSGAFSGTAILVQFQVEGYEIFIKFLPPSATGDALKTFFSEATDSSRSLGVWSVMAAMTVMALSDFFRSFNARLQAGPIVPWLRKGLLDYGMFTPGEEVGS